MALERFLRFFLALLCVSVLVGMKVAGWLEHAPKQTRNGVN